MPGLGRMLQRGRSDQSDSLLPTGVSVCRSPGREQRSRVHVTKINVFIRIKLVSDVK